MNIVDNSIARKDFADSAFTLGLEAQSVNNGDSLDFSYQNNIGGLNISAAYKDSQFDDYEIPDGAVMHHQEEHETEEHEGEDQPYSLGRKTCPISTQNLSKTYFESLSNPH